SFKWFSLAAAQGDADSGRKRDDIAKRLDPQSLAAAKLAIQTFTAEPQPDDAVNVATPAGGWDNAPAQTAAAKPAAEPGKRAAPVAASHEIHVPLRCRRRRRDEPSQEISLHRAGRLFARPHPREVFVDDRQQRGSGLPVPPARPWDKPK